MNIVVFQENLLKQITLAGKFLPSKSTSIPALNNFLLQAEGDEIKITASNIETTITVVVPGKIEMEGTALLPAKMLLSLIPTLSGEKISLVLEGTSLLVKSDKAEVSLRVENAQDFPKNSQEGELEVVGLSREFLLEMVRKVCFAASGDPMRAVLTGVLLQSREGTMLSAATDGFRLSRLIKKEEAQKDFNPIVLPSRVLDVISSIVKESEEEKISLSLLKGGTQAQFVFPGCVLTTQLIEGKFPDFERIIPNGYATRLVFNRDELVQAVRFASVLAREAANIVRIKVEKGKVNIMANAPQTGKNSMEVGATVEGDDVETAFNYRFLLDFLSSGEDQEVVFETGGSLSPGVFRYGKSVGYLYIVMPVRLQDSQ